MIINWLKKIDKKYWSIIGGTVALVLWIIINRPNNQSQNVEIPETKPTIPIGESRTSNAYLEGVKSPTKIVWGESEIKLEKRMNGIKIKPANFEAERVNQIIEVLQVKDLKQVMEKGQLVLYSSEKGDIGMDFNKETGTVKFFRDLLLFGSEELLSKDGGLEQQEYKEKFEQIVNAIVGTKDNLRVVITGISYEEVVGPRYVTAEESTANVIKVEAVYEYKKKPVYGIWGKPMTARFNKKGELLQLKIELIEDIEEEKNVALWSLDEIKMAEAGEFKMILANGTREMDQSEWTDPMGTVTINKGYSGWWWIPTENIMMPWHFLEGSTLTKYGPAKIILGIEAVR